jgi:hypothetical protein
MESYVIPTLFFFEGLPISRNADYHTWRDRAGLVDTDKIENTCKLVHQTACLLANNESRPPAQRFWADLWGQPGWDQRAAFAMRQLFPTPAYMRQRYQTGTGWALPLFYPYRWLLGVRGVIAMKLPIKTREE